MSHYNRYLHNHKLVKPRTTTPYCSTHISPKPELSATTQDNPPLAELYLPHISHLKELPLNVVALIKLKGCKFITSRPNEVVKFCNIVKLPGKPYCSYHCSVCYANKGKDVVEMMMGFGQSKNL